METTVSGYTITEKLYESASTVVCRGLRDRESLPVILKIRKDADSSSKSGARFRREYELIREINLPGVPEIYELITDQNRLVMVMNDFGGISLNTPEIRKEMTPASFLELAVKISDILGRIHHKGIIHRDINPSNIVANMETGEVRLIDFGISDIQSPGNTASDLPKGAPAYMSPEQTGRTNRQTDFRTDFYSLGVTFYELLTGELPFVSQDPLELIHCHIARQPVPPYKKTGISVPRVLSDIIMKLMEKNAEDRYQSAFGLKSDLQQCLNQIQIQPFPDRSEIPGVSFRGAYIRPFELGENDFSDRFQIPTKLYGRENETKTLINAFEQASSGRSGIALVSGFSGTGKSVLISEIRKTGAGKRGYSVSGKFEGIRQDIPYHAFAQAFGELVRMVLTEKEANLDAWRETITHAVGNIGKVLTDVIPGLELIIGKQPDIPELSPTEAQNRFSYAFESFVKAVSRKARPLLLFLDDLQWADSASLNLMKALMSNPDITHFLLIAAYRDNEVGPGHPLTQVLEEINSQKIAVTRVSLGPLSPEHTARLIADTLGTDRVAPLAESVIRKTGGNPFFLGQFLGALYEEALIRFDYEQRCWTWDTDRIKARDITDNVAELMIRRLKKLGSDTQNALSLAAHTGDRFDLETLAVICGKRPEAVYHALVPAIREGLVLTSSFKEIAEDDISADIVANDLQNRSTGFRFLHDRVREAAHTLVPEEQEAEVCLRIGRLMLESTDPEEQEEQLFGIVGLMNQGCALLAEESERNHLAALNLEAGKKAKASAAFQEASEYFRTGLTLLTEKSWNNAYPLTLSLHEEAAETAYIIGESEATEKFADTVITCARSIQDTLRIHEIRIQSYLIRNMPLKAVRSGLRVLKDLGIRIPENPGSLYIMSEMLRTKTALARKCYSDLTSLPKMTDPLILAEVRILSSIFTGAMISVPAVMPLVVCSVIRLSLRHGNSPMSLFAYANYGLILCLKTGNIGAGYKFCSMAADMAGHAGSLGPRIVSTMDMLIRHRKEPIRKVIKHLLESYHACLESGDIEYAGHVMSNYCLYSFFSGRKLSGVRKEMTEYAALLRQKKLDLSADSLCSSHQAVLNLIGSEGEPCRLDGEALDREPMLAFFIKENMEAFTFFIFFNTLALSCIFRRYSKGLRNAERAEQYAADTRESFYSASLFYFYDSLVRLGMYPDMTREERKRSLGKIRANQKKLRKWAKHAPANYLNKYYLVEAEQHRVLKQYNKAREFFEQAVALSAEHQFLNEEALTRELAANFFVSIRHYDLAGFYMRSAYRCYQRWGAGAKLRQMEELYPEYVTRGKLSVSGTVPGSMLDMGSILKASRAISGEIVLEKLLAKMMKIVIENAGAEKGFLILEQKGRWVIQAQGTARSDDVKLFGSVPIQDTSIIPPSVVNYVIRTRENVILEDAGQEGTFTRDPYIVSQRPLSVLCMPLMNQNRLTGILYLENNLTPAAFTQDRLEVLNLLSSQAAISIENAGMYDMLEHKVAERTAELTRAKEAAETANRAKSVFLASMSHELRTPLNGVLGYAGILRNEPGMSDRQIQGLNIIEQSGRHLLSLINDVLDLAKVESGKIEVYETEFSFPDFLRGVAGIIRVRAQEKGLDFYPKLSDNLPLYVRADERRLRQVLLNLLGNAVKFTDKGSVGLRVVRGEGREVRDADPETEETVSHLLPLTAHPILFEVRDTGIGIAEEDIKKIFDPFQQAGDQKYRVKGTGLGLAISRNLVKLMGGNLEVESQPGKGSVFGFTLALTEIGYETGKTDRPERPVIGVKGTPRKILVVDDNRENRAVFRGMLSIPGFEIREAVSGLDGIEKAVRFRPDLIITDLIMPESDGFWLIRRIRESSDMKATPIIATSASVYEVDHQNSMDAGADAFLPKPAEPDRLFGDIRRLLNLEWIYQESPHPRESQKEGASEFVLPDSDRLEALLDLSVIGDIEEIHNLLDEMVRSDEKMGPFVRKIRGMAEEFRVNHIRELLKEYIRAENREEKKSALVVPPTEKLEALLEFSDSGDVEEIHQYLDELDRIGYGPFAVKLGQLAWAFEFEEMSELLTEYLRDPSTGERICS